MLPISVGNEPPIPLISKKMKMNKKMFRVKYKFSFTIIITHMNHSILLKSKYSKEVRFPISDGILFENELFPIPTKK